MPYRAYIGCCYMATNLTNGSIYIGKTIATMHRRKMMHFSAMRKGEMPPFICALRKYGKDAFEWRELYMSDDDASLKAAEISLIASYKEAGFRMYNITLGGEGFLGKVISPEARAAMTQGSRSETGRASYRASWTPERKAALAARMSARVVTDESRRKLSEARKGMVFTPEHCEAIRLSKLGNKYRKGTGA